METLLINILSDDGLRSQALLDLMKPTHDGLSYAKQLQKDRHSKVPTYPYTTIPVVPPQLYQPGLSSKEGLQEIPGCDPYVMVRTPKLYRLRPPRAPPDMAYLRSTWILQDAQWQQIEDKVDPNLEPVRFDRWVERAFFQFHPLSSPLPEVSAPASGHLNAAILPRLLFSLRPLVQCRELQQTLRDSSLYLSIHHCSTSALHVLNALTRLVHGGNGGSGGSSMIFDNFVSDPEEQAHSVHDHWEVDEEAKTLTRIHSSPRRKAFCPGDAPSCPVDMSRVKDDRMTYRQGSQFESSDFEDCVKDYWRHSGRGTHTKTHLRWIGKTVFTLRGNDAESENEEAQSAAIALCSTPKRMKTIPLKDIIVPTFVSVSKAKSEESKEHRIVDVNLRRHDGEIAYRYQFVLYEEDDNLAARDEQMVIDLYDIGKEPAFILLCSEECNHFTHLAAKHDCTIVTVSQSDDLTSPYGIARALAAVRSEKDTVMFAGPCTGGSAWSRYNAKVSDAIAKSIELKRALYWDLWERFETVMTRVLRIGAAALFELPRYCAYWKDQRVQRLLSGTDCDCHVFDGCMYGLGAEFNDSHSDKKLIKKPWKIVSWNLEFGDQLSRTCDKSHSHRDCAGKYTKTTQLYNKKIVGIILKTVTKRIAEFQKSEKMMHAVPCLMIRALGSSFNERSVCGATSNETVYTCDEHGTQISHVRRIEPHGIHNFQACCVCLCDHSTASPVRFSDVAMASVGGVMNYNSNTSGYPTFIIKILDGLVEMKERGQITLPPRMSRSTHGLDVVEAWIAVGIPPLVPLSINYAMSRTKSDDTKFLTASLKKLVDPYGFINFVRDRIDDVKRHEPTSIHVWLSLSNLVTAGEKGTYKTVIVPTDFVPRLRDVIVKLDACCQLPTFVRICADVEFHHAVGSFGKIANMIKDELSLNGMMSTTSDRFWRAISVAGSGHPYSMKSGTSLVHTVMEKYLFREKMLASCFMAPDPLTEANSLHDPNLEHVLQDKERLYQYLFGDSVRGSHAYQSTAEPSGENESERRKREKVRRENKMPWMDEYWGVLQPEPIYSRTQRWYVIDDFKEGEEICCDYCLVCHPIDSDLKDDCYAECINGAANRCRGMSAEDYVQKRFHACARLLHNFGMGQTVSSPTIVISEMNPHDDLMKFLHEAMIIFNENPGFQKEISFFGGIRLSSTMTENFFKTRRGPSIHVEKQIIGNAKYFQGSYDLGNVCYTKYLKTILEPDVFRTIFGDDPTEERVGDMVEALLGMFEIAQLFRHLFRGWGDIEALRTGLEESIKRVTASLYDRTTYENRKRSMIRTMDPHSDEAANVALILVRMRTMPPPEFDIDHFFEIGKEPEQGTEATDQPEAEGVDMETECGQEKEEQDVDMSDPKTSILQAIDEFERKIGQAEFCIHCMESGHTTLNCEKNLSSSPSVTSVLSDWKKRVKGEVAPDDVPSGHPTEEPKKKKQRASPTPERKVDSEFKRKEMLKARVVTMFDHDGFTLIESADGVEGGPHSYNGRKLVEAGPKDMKVVYEFVEKAFVHSSSLTPKACHHFYPLPTRREKGYKLIDPMTMVGKVELVPINGVTFAAKNSDYGNHKYPTPDCRVPEYSQTSQALSRRLGAKLRHRIGRQFRTGGRLAPIKCDEGAWVSWEDLLGDNAVWEDGYHYGNIDIVTKKARLEKYFDQNYECFRITKRVRFQMLAVRVHPDELNEPDDPMEKGWINELKDMGISKGRLHHSDGWCFPVAVRATSAHSTDGGGYDVTIDIDHIGSRMTNDMALSMVTAFHATNLGALTSIMRRGLVPGGLGSSGRDSIHFTCFPPWAWEQGYKGKPWLGRKVALSDRPVVLYIPVWKLQEYGLLISATGSLLVENVVPFDEVKGAWLQCDNAEPGQPEKIEWIRLLNGEPDPGSYLVLESKYGNPIMIPRFQKLESLAVEVLDDTYSEDDAKISKLLGMIEESGVYPEYDNTEWQELFEEIVYRRAMKDYDSRPCPNCLGEVDVRLTICPHCVAVLIANGKLTHVVPKETRDRNQRSPPKDVPASSSGETTSAAGANIDEVIKNARKTAEEVIEIGESEGEEEEEVPIILKERPDEAEGEPEYREVPQDGYGNELPRPSPFAIDELPQEAAIPIDHNFAVTQQFDLRLMKLIKSLANATFDINCFENREDVLRMFDDGQRHDTPHNRWPIVPKDPDTGFPRRLKRDEVVGMSRWTDDGFATEAWQIYEFHANVVHPMMITAIRCGLSHKYLKEVGSTQRSMSDPKARKSETQDEIIEKLAFISNFIRRMIKKTFGASRYSYYQKPDDESAAPYKFIDISPAIKSERKNVTKEILVACRYYGIEVSDIQERKLKSFEEQIRAGNPRNVELIKDYIGFVGADYMRQLTNG